MAAAIDISNYARCHKAIQLVCHRAGPCVDSVLQSWHHNKTQLIPHCSRPRPRPPSNPLACSDRGKPKSSKSCRNCVQWGAAVEAEYYPPNLKGSMAWNNVNPSVLSSHYMEVAKAFVLRLQTNHTSTKATDFDSASFLKFMMHFGEFHQRDRVSFDVIKKVSNIRNTLSHMKLNENLSLTDQDVSDYFDNIRDMVSCLEILHPQEFTKKYADDIRSSLTDILQSPVTERMKQEVLKPFTDAMKMTVISTLEDQFQEHSHVLTTSVKQDLKDHSDTVTTILTQQADEHSDTLTTVLTQHADEQTQRLGSMTDRLVDRLGSMTDRLVETTEETAGRLHGIESKIADVEGVQRTLADQVEECLTQQSVPVKDEGPLDVARCREQLKLEYRSSRGKIPLLPGMPEEFASMEDLYVDLELSENQKHPSGVTKKKLESLHDLCNIKDKQGNILKRVLVKGGPGSGKTMLVSKLAYDWSTCCLQNTKCDLLFALDLREITEDMDLIDVIQDQLLPKVRKPQLLEYIESNANYIIYLLDAFDELTNTKLGTDLTAMLSNKWLQESLVIVTTRPHKCHEFGRDFGMYTLIDVLDLSFQRIIEFVGKFLNISPYLQHVYGEVERQTDRFNTDTEHPSVTQNKEKIMFVLIKLWEGRLKYHYQIKGSVQCVWELYSFLNASESVHANFVKLKTLTSDILQTTWKTCGPPIKYIQACSRVLTVMNGLGQTDFLERCSSLNSSKELEASSLMRALNFTCQLCKCHVEIQSKIDEIDLDLSYLEKSTDCLYKPDETISKAVRNIRVFVGQLRELCTDMKKLLPEIRTSISKLNTYRRFKRGLEISHQLHKNEEIRIKRSIGSPSIHLKSVNELCRLLTLSLIIVEKVQVQFEARTLASALFSSIQEDMIDEEDISNEDTAWQSFCHSYDYDQKNIDGLRKTASDIIGVFEKLATLKLHDELQRKLEELQLILATLSRHCYMTDLQPIIDQLCSNVTSLTTPYDNTNDLKPEFHSAMSFLKSITSKSKEDTEKKINEAISFLTLLKTNEEYQLLSEIPITLTMICLLWKDSGDATLPETMTSVFEKCISYMAGHNEVKTLKQQDLDYEIIDEKLGDIMKQIGETALIGLLQNKLVFSGKNFNASILNEACRLGLLTKEKKRSKLRSVDMITFIHKSFQEFCAAHYLVHLLEANRDEFTTIVSQINAQNYEELVLMLQFSCGLNSMAAFILLPHVVDMSLKKPKRLGDFDYVWGHQGNAAFSIEDTVMMMNNVSGGFDYEKARVPLALFQEAQVPALIRFMRPLFPNKELNLCLSRHTLPYFLDCVLKSPEYNILDHVESANINFGNLFTIPLKQEAKVAGSLLKCIHNLTSLRFFCHYEDYQIFVDNDGAILEGLQLLRKLQSLTLGGYGEVAILRLLRLFDECKYLNTLSEIILRLYGDGDAISIPEIATLISKQTKLSRLIISTFLFDCTKSKTKSKRLGDRSNGFLWCHALSVKAMLESIHTNARMTEIILQGYHVPPECIIKFLGSLRVLEIRCPDKSWKPFNSNGLFSGIISVGQEAFQVEESKQELTPSALPLGTLVLDNGRLSNNDVHAFATAIEFITCLDTLVFGWDSLSEECFPIIATKLMCLSHLRILNLAGNPIGNSIESLCESLESKPLESLDMTHTHLSLSGAVILGRYLQVWPDLVELDLSENQVGKGLLTLNRGLPHLVKLQKLRLVDTNLTDKGIAGLPLQHLAQLVELDISGKQCYGPKGVESLFRKVHYVENLKAMLLTFKDNWIQENPFLNMCWQTCNFGELRIASYPWNEEPKNEPIVLKVSHIQMLRECVRHL